MPFVLDDLVGAVTGITALVKATTPLVQAIRSGFLANNGKAQQELTGKLEALEQSVKKAGQVASIADAYLETYESVLGLLWRCRGAREYLKDHYEACNAQEGPEHDLHWRILDARLSEMNLSMGAVRQVTLNRTAWYDNQDSSQINLRVNDFTLGHQRATGALRSKSAFDLQRDFEEMVARLEDVETSLRNTLYEKILKPLQTLQT